MDNIIITFDKNGKIYPRTSDFFPFKGVHEKKNY